MGALLPDVFCLVRFTDKVKDLSVLIVNRSRAEQRVELGAAQLAEGPDADKPLILKGMLVDVLTGETIAAGSTLRCVIPPLTARLYTR